MYEYDAIIKTDSMNGMLYEHYRKAQHVLISGKGYDDVTTEN